MDNDVLINFTLKREKDVSLGSVGSIVNKVVVIF